jgi:hypothetical protein
VHSWIRTNIHPDFHTDQSAEYVARALADYFSCQKVGAVKCTPQELQSPSTTNRHLIDLLTSISAPHFGHFAKSFAKIIHSQLFLLDMSI